MDGLFASINRWVAENLWLVPFTWIALGYAIWAEKKRLHERIDAILTLLKARGIDIFDRDGRIADPDDF
jgi:hypothetical protein